MRYDFECENCEVQFEISCSMDEVVGLKPECPDCKKNDAVFRLFGGIVVSTTRTLGALMDKNTSKMSEDHKHHLNEKHNHYRKKEFTGKLPKGMSTYERDKDGNRVSGS